MPLLRYNFTIQYIQKTNKSDIFLQIFLYIFVQICLTFFYRFFREILWIIFHLFKVFCCKNFFIIYPHFLQFCGQLSSSPPVQSEEASPKQPFAKQLVFMPVKLSVFLFKFLAKVQDCGNYGRFSCHNLSTMWSGRNIPQSQQTTPLFNFTHHFCE